MNIATKTNYKIQHAKQTRLILNLFGLTCFLLIINISKAISQEVSFGKTKFIFNEVTYTMFLNEISSLEKNSSLNQEVLRNFVASLPFLEPALASANIPYDFKFLSIYRKYQRSVLSKNTLESGIFWCLTLEKASKLNLSVNDQIDDRKHLSVATSSVIDLMNRKHLEYQNWGTVLFSLLAHEDVITELQINDKWKSDHILLDSPKYSNLIDFLAFKALIEANYVKIGNLEHKMVYMYKAAGGKNLNELAELLSVNVHELIAANQWLTEGHVPENSRYPVILYIPVSKYYEIKKLESSEGSNAKLDSGFPVLSLNETLSKGLGGTFYTINGLPGIQAQMGDQFINLAYKANVSHKKFLVYNDMKPLDAVSIGKVYYLKEKNDRADIPYHVAKPNETLWDISQLYAIKLEKLIGYNRLEGVTKLLPGQLIWMRSKRPKNEPVQYLPIAESESESINTPVLMPKISDYSYSANTDNTPTLKQLPKAEETVVFIKPAENVMEHTGREDIKEIAEPEDLKNKKMPEETPKKKFLVHEVKSGETLFELAQKYNVEIKKLYELNNLYNSMIEVGDKLIIKRN